MTNKVWNVIGNGDKWGFYTKKKRDGKNLICNQPPFAIPPEDVYATCIVDFKMMKSLTEGSLNLNMYPWILGTRPKIWMENNPLYNLRMAPNIKEYYTNVPTYAENATNFNCGHMAVHYAANKKSAEQINMFGFDTLFDYNMNSVTDLYLSSDRGNVNNYRLLHVWRPIWEHLFREFPDTEFVLHHDHSDIKIDIPDNVTIETYATKKGKQLREIQKKKDLIETKITLNRKQRRAHEAAQRKKKK